MEARIALFDDDDDDDEGIKRESRNNGQTVD